MNSDRVPAEATLIALDCSDLPAGWCSVATYEDANGHAVGFTIGMLSARNKAR